jgi:hypothetical protein
MVGGLVISAALAVSPPPADAERGVTETGSPATRSVSGADSIRPGTYVVVLRGQPAATYDGHLAGYPATRPRAAQRFNDRRPQVLRYRHLLLTSQRRLLARLGNPRELYAYTTAINGFAVDLDAAQVKALRGRPDVISVERQSTSTLDTLDPVVRRPERAGRTPRAGRGQVGRSSAGQGVVVGVIDSGIWPENPSFAGPAGAGARARALRTGFTGRCEPGEAFTAEDCNAKVVAARYFVRGFGPDNIATADYLSPRDGTGHGSHTAAVAVGDDGVDVRIDGQPMGRVSGVAPAAHLAVYKACWAAPDPADDGCMTADTVMAIDQAVRDGVDVINYSVSGTRTDFADAVELAFLNAAAAGVFVATSAGNAGPRAATVAHPGPWLTSVSATSEDPYRGAVVLGDGRRLTGAMVSNRLVPASPLILAGASPASGASHHDSRLCQPGSLDAARAEGAIVICDRGVIPRADKSQAVRRAGGIGMVLVNTRPDGLDADVHAVPTVHLDVRAGHAVKHYIRSARGRATALLDPAGRKAPMLPRIAGFSSRGPSLAGGGDILKPDISAAGVSVVGAVAPPSSSGRLWDLYSGTSTAAAQVAGLAARITAARPAWSPAEIRSALMTTAYDVPRPSTPFAQGAGHPDPARALDPGLVYNSGIHDWLAFLSGQRITDAGASPLSRHPMSASDLNSPSIAVGAMVGREVVRRSVTNVADTPETYSASVTGLSGIEATVRPSTITVRPGRTASFSVRFTVLADADYGRFSTGTLTWTGSNGHRVRSPVVVEPVRLSARPEVAGNASDGSLRVDGMSGVVGDIPVSSAGLVGAAPVRLSLAPAPIDLAHPAQGRGTAVSHYVVPRDTAALRFEVRADRADDVDLFVYRRGTLISSSAGPGGDEQITIGTPTPGRYDVYVNDFAAANGLSAAATFTGWVLPGSRAGRAAGSLTVQPNPVPVSLGQPFDYTASWSGLDPGLRWFGAISYRGSDATTYVTVN